MLTKGSVLVVDDEINLCRILGAKLAKSGYSVVAVHDGQQAIDKVREADFDVVLLDLILPKVDGLSALAEIRILNHDLPVIVMTACESSDALERARSHGVSGYINKPFDLDSLVELVQMTSAGSPKHVGKRQADSTVLFAANQPITLEILNGRKAGPFQSRIECRDDRTVSVTAPMVDGSIIDVPSRTPVRVGLATKDAYYSFNSYVLAVKKSDGPVMVLDKPGVIYRAQRRLSPRVQVEMAVRYGKLKTVDAEHGVLAAAKSCDVSTGGIKIVTLEKLDPGDLVYIETDQCGAIGPITAVAEVVRARKSESEPVHVVAMQFRQVQGNLGGLLVD